MKRIIASVLFAVLFSSAFADGQNTFYVIDGSSKEKFLPVTWRRDKALKEVYW